MIHNTRHDNIVAVLETFRFGGSFYVILERMGISLLQIVASPPYPGEQELAAISGQVGQTDQQLRSICLLGRYLMVLPILPHTTWSTGLQIARTFS